MHAIKAADGIGRSKALQPRPVCQELLGFLSVEANMLSCPTCTNLHTTTFSLSFLQGQRIRALLHRVYRCVRPQTTSLYQYTLPSLSDPAHTHTPMSQPQ